MKKIIFIILSLCCVVGLSSCGIKSSVKNHKPEDVAEKYISAYCNGNLEEIFKYSICDIDYDTVVKEQANSLEKGDEFNDECFDEAIENGISGNKKIIEKAFENYKKGLKEYYAYDNITVIGKEFVEIEDAREDIEEINEDINERLTKNSEYIDYWETRILPKFVVDPNNVTSFCRVKVSIDFTIEEEPIVLSVCLVENDDGWWIYPAEIDDGNDEEIYGDIDFLSCVVWRSDPL